MINVIFPQLKEDALFKAVPLCLLSRHRRRQK